ncbi:histidine phosphatase superfamily [Xylariaceae sp. FL0594]|nr:histidine phosphatase superfamily [Xylariaceae sp. FL0594]
MPSPWVKTGLLLGLGHASSASSLYSSYHFNALEHMGGVAPYFEPQDPPASPAPPQGCTPVKAAYLSRHAAIYANDFDYEEYIEPFIEKLENHTSIDWSKVPSLNFLAGWTAPITDAEQELMTRVGKVEATQLGATLSFRYANLKLPSRVWTSSAERTFKSAQSLVRGLETDDDTIGVVSIYESKEAGANSLTPYKSCPAYSGSTGSEQAEVYTNKFTGPIAERLNGLAPGFNFTANDVYGMMELCGYESVIRGASPFCDLDLFTPDDWLGWEYSADIMYHYNVGYGNPVSGFVGLPWLNTTAQLLLSDDDKNGEELYVSFTHRELPPMVVVAMGLFNNSAFAGTADRINDTMPLDRINYRRAWKSSHILPFLGNLAIERLNCTKSPGYADGEYYRALVNSAPQPLPDCADGPGTTCSRDGFEAYIRDRVEMFSGFSDKCGVDYDNSTDYVTFYTEASDNGTSFFARRPLWMRHTPHAIMPRTSIPEFRDLVTSSKRILALCGAGLSAASGLPTFRGDGGLWRNYEPTTLATPEAFEDDPALVWLFYAWRKHRAMKAKPNMGHYALAQLASRKEEGFLCLSQNVDGLHHRAGHPPSQLRLLHGSILDVKCFDEKCGYIEHNNLSDPPCPALAPASQDLAPGSTTLPLLDPRVPAPVIARADLPQCPKCEKALLRPGVVWFGEGLDEEMLDGIDDWIEKEKVDLMLVIGTAAAVYPAAGYTRKARNAGAVVAVVNLDPDAAEGLVSGDFFFQGSAAEILPKLFEGVIGTMSEETGNHE